MKIALASLLFVFVLPFSANAKTCHFLIEGYPAVIEFATKAARVGTQVSIEYQNVFSKAVVSSVELVGTSYGPTCDSEFCMTAEIVKVSGPMTQLTLIDDLDKVALSGVINAQSFATIFGDCK